MHRKRVLWLLALILCLGLYISCESWISFYLLVVVLFLPLLSLLCSLPFVTRKVITQSHPSRVMRGDKSAVILEIPGKKANPLSCRVDVSVKDLMGAAQRIETLTLFCGESLPFELDTAHCGRYEIEVVQAVFTDFLGFFAFHARCPEAFFVSVDPIPTRPDPEPDFSRFVPMRFYPRRSGGFSENHELKEYTPGDPVNTIHWKLSAKTDKTIVREPQDQEQSKVYLTMDLVPDREEMDFALGSLAWISNRLISQEVPFSVCYIKGGEEDAICITELRLTRDFVVLLDEVMSTVPAAGVPSLAGRSFPGATWRFHVNPRSGDERGAQNE